MGRVVAPRGSGHAIMAPVAKAMPVKALGRSAARQSSQDSEEARVHPSDTDKTPYTFAGFMEFSQGDTDAAQAMWEESHPVPVEGTAPAAKRLKTNTFFPNGVASQVGAARRPTPPASAPPLPPGWVKHMSDEYNIPFYWNEETEETTWERPV